MGYEDILVFQPYILMVQVLGYLHTPCTGGFRHSDEAIFGIFLISMNLRRHSEGAGSDSYHFSLFDPPINIIRFSHIISDVLNDNAKNCKSDLHFKKHV